MYYEYLRNSGTCDAKTIRSTDLESAYSIQHKTHAFTPIAKSLLFSVIRKGKNIYISFNSKNTDIFASNNTTERITPRKCCSAYIAHCIASKIIIIKWGPYIAHCSQDHHHEMGTLHRSLFVGSSASNGDFALLSVRRVTSIKWGLYIAHCSQNQYKRSKKSVILSWTIFSSILETPSWNFLSQLRLLAVFPCA